MQSGKPSSDDDYNKDDSSDSSGDKPILSDDDGFIILQVQDLSTPTPTDAQHMQHITNTEGCNYSENLTTSPDLTSDTESSHLNHQVTSDDHVFIEPEQQPTPVDTTAQPVQHDTQIFYHESFNTQSNYHYNDEHCTTEDQTCSTHYLLLESQSQSTSFNTQINNMHIEIPPDNLGITHHFSLSEIDKYKALGIEEEAVHCPMNNEECSVIFRFLLRLFICSVPFLVFVTIFSAEGYGRETMAISKEYTDKTRRAGIVIAALILIFYVFDVTYWKSKLCQYLAFAIIYIGIIAIAFFNQTLYPIGPLCLFIILYPLYMLGIKEAFYSTVSLKSFFLAYAQPMNIGSALGLVSWMLWCVLGYGWSLEGQENLWGTTSKIRYSQELDCPANFEDFPYCRNTTLYKLSGQSQPCFQVRETDSTKSIFTGGYGSETISYIEFDSGCDFYCVRLYDQCFDAFLVWSNAPLLALGMGLLSFVFVLACKPYQRIISSHEDANGPHSMDINDAVKLATKMYIILVFVIGTTANLAGAGKGLVRAFLDFTVSSMIAVAIVIFSVLSEENPLFSNGSPIHELIRESPMTKLDTFLEQYQPYTDALRGLALLTLLPIILFYFVLSFANECVRRSGLFPFVEQYNDDDDSVLTRRVQMQIEQLCSWKDTCRVYRYALYWGILYMIMSVIIQKYLLASLIWLIQITQSMPLGLVVFILSVISVLLFLAPPIPSAPVFITTGILIFAAGHERLGIAGCTAFCASISMICRYVAWCILQVGVGRSLTDNAEIRQMVGMNSPFVRGIRVILSVPGFSFSKICIMVGSPDWPLAVLCGMLQLPLVSTMIATFPNIFLIIPNNLTGAFAYMSSLQGDDGTLLYPWASSMGALMVLISIITQVSSLALFGFYLEKEIKSRKDEIENLPIDTEVAILDQEAESSKEAYTIISKWESLKRWERFSLRLALLLMSISCYAAQLLDDICFTKTNFLDVSGAEQIRANTFDIIKPFGYKVLAVFIVSFFIIISFERRTGKRIFDHQLSKLRVVD